MVASEQAVPISTLKIDRVLIYRLGSLGDTIVALPCFNLIARAYPDAERCVLTNFPYNHKASPLQSILDGSGLVHSYLQYPLRQRDPRQFLRLRKEITAKRPDVLIYLAQPRGTAKTIRDALFFKWCGIKTLVGVPYSKHLAANQWHESEKRYESEAGRLARCLETIGNAKVDDPSSWDLHLTSTELAAADRLLAAWPGRSEFVVCSLGTKFNVNEWGVENWRDLLGRVSARSSSMGLVLVGVAGESDVSDQAAANWKGPKLNLCGKLTPRETGAVIKNARAFLGQDSGPMHLATSVGLPCVAVFSARNKPGIWFPNGSAHRIIYHQTPCYGCGLEFCEQFAKACITSVTVDEVLSAVNSVLPRIVHREYQALKVAESAA